MRVRGQHCVDLQDAMIGLSAHAFGDGSVRRSQVGAIDAVEGREDIELDEVRESAIYASLQKLVEVAVHRREGGAEVEEDGASVGLEEHLVPADDARAVPYREPRAHSPMLLSCPPRKREAHGGRRVGEHLPSEVRQDRRAPGLERHRRPAPTAPVMPLVFAAIAPHGGIAVAEATPPEKRELAARTRAAMEELGRRFAAARPDATILLTPHHVHVEGALAVIVSNRLRGELGEDGHRIELTVPVDRALALAVLRAIGDAGVRVVGVSFGGNDPSSAVAPMDWGTLIPLWFMGGRADAPVPAGGRPPGRGLAPDDPGHDRAAAAAPAA